MKQDYYKSRLKNLGNTCYQNAVLMPLIHTPGNFIKILNEFFYKVEKDTISYVLYKMIKNILENRNHILNPRQLKKVVGEKNILFAGFEQNDSQEFLSFLIDSISEELGKEKLFFPSRKVDISNLDKFDKLLNMKAESQYNLYLKKYYSSLVENFYGMFRSKIIYNDSMAMKNNFTPFNILSLSIPKLGKNLSLNDCLKYFNRKEELDQNNLVESKMNYGKQKISKQESLWKLPNYLFIHLKRFEYNDYGKILKKDNTPVFYPEEIDFSNVIDPSSKYKNLDNKYYLYALTLHQGILTNRLSCGHYISYVKNKYNNKWYLYNDDKPVERVYNIQNNNTYILYYAKKLEEK